MKICHIAPPETNSLVSRGGPTRVFFDLNEGLAQLDPDLHVYAQRDARTHGHLAYFYDTNLNDAKFYRDEPLDTTKECYGIIHYTKAYEYAKDFDIIQSHIDRPLFFTKFYPKPISVITIHGPMTNYRRLMVETFNGPNIHFVIPSGSIEAGVAKVCQNYSIIHNAIDLTVMKPRTKKSDYFLYVGRLVPYKEAHLAIEACVAMKQKLILIGKPDENNEVSRKYFAEKIKPHLQNSLIEHISVVPHEKVFQYYENAKAFVYPLWHQSSEEAFGLVLAEALGSGTPIVTFENPLTKELLGHGPVAYLAKDFEDFKTGLTKVGQFSPLECRKYAEKYFSRERMARDYYNLYQKLLSKRQ